MSTLEFTKMHGLGNDFVVLDGVSHDVVIDGRLARRLANRRFGVGCDQILVVEKATRADADFRFRIFNADGSEVEHCGNGLRCVARFLRDQGLTDKRELVIESLQSLSVVHLRENGLVTVDMGQPELEPARIPFLAERREASYVLEVEGETHRIGAVSMGNPHAVLSVRNVDSAPVNELGPRIEGHEAFPRRVNVGFMHALGRDHIRLRVYERGVGETLACGTGACAAVVVGRLWGLLGPEVAVELPGGQLMIHWSGEGSAVWMTGPAVTVFAGRMPAREPA